MNPPLPKPQLMQPRLRNLRAIIRPGTEKPLHVAPRFRREPPRPLLLVGIVTDLPRHGPQELDGRR
jgi:hypothetical protein